MARYIDADKLIEMYERSAEDDWNKKTAPSSWAEAFECAIADIDDQPTADVVPKSEVAREFIEIINDRIDNIRARIPYGGRAQGKTLAVEKMRLLESLKVEIAKKYTEERE